MADAFTLAYGMTFADWCTAFTAALRLGTAHVWVTDKADAVRVEFGGECFVLSERDHVAAVSDEVNKVKAPWIIDYAHANTQ